MGNQLLTFLIVLGEDFWCWDDDDNIRSSLINEIKKILNLLNLIGFRF